jgi:hypothetical protein
MSDNLAYALPRTTGPDVLEELGGRPRPIEIVTSRSQRRARPRIVYALVATAALFVLLLTQLGISIALSDGAYQISALQNTQTELGRSQQKYSEKLQVLSSPQNVANNAAALGMVRNQNPVYLDLTSGAVFGTPQAAAPEASSSGNLIANSLLGGVPVVTKGAKASKAATSSSAPGAAAPKSAGASVPSTTNQLAAPETR